MSLSITGIALSTREDALPAIVHHETTTTSIAIAPDQPGHRLRSAHSVTKVGPDQRQQSGAGVSYLRSMILLLLLLAHPAAAAVDVVVPGVHGRVGDVRGAVDLGRRLLLRLRLHCILLSPA